MVEKESGSQVSLTNPDDTGRGKHKHRGKGRFRCRDNKPLWERLEELVKEIVEEVLNEGSDPKVQQQIERNRKREKTLGCRRLGLRTFEETPSQLSIQYKRLKRVNCMEKSDLKCFSYVGNHCICEKSVNSYKWLFL